MEKRKVLTIATAAVALLGLLLTTIPFVNSMLPNKVVKNTAKTRISLTDIPAKGALALDHRSYKALIVKKPQLQVFLMPYYNNAYLLPDPTWDRAFIPCSNFILHDDRFSCEDPTLHKSWNKQAIWDLAGKNLGAWMPDLIKAKFRIEGNYLTLSPEYN